MVPFSNGRREGANPSSRVTERPDLEFSNQFHRPVILFWIRDFGPWFRNTYFGWPITPVQKRSVATPFIFVVFQVERETVMITQKYFFLKKWIKHSFFKFSFLFKITYHPISRKKQSEKPFFCIFSEIQNNFFLQVRKNFFES